MNPRHLALMRGNRRLRWDDSTELEGGDRVVMAVRDVGWGAAWDFLAEEPVIRSARKGKVLF